MKRILTLALMLLVAIGAKAQISNVKVREASAIIMRFRTGHCSVRLDRGIYYLTLPSTNRFDDPFIFYIGDSRESAIKTLVDIQQLISKMKKRESASFNIYTQGLGHPYRIIKASSQAIYFDVEGYAGIVSLSTYEIDSIIDKICLE